MAYVTRAARDRAHAEADWRKICECGHRQAEHHELKPHAEWQDGLLVMVDHPDYKPFHFHCDHEGCDCVKVATVK